MFRLNKNYWTGLKLGIVDSIQQVLLTVPPKFTRRINPEDQHLHLYHCENLKYQTQEVVKQI